jgi:DNA-binding NarL/FixJ family response regulator
MTDSAVMASENSSGTRVWRVLVVDDHPLVRVGLASVINSEPDLEVCAEAGSVAAALEAVRASRPDLVVTDLSLPDGNGMDLIKRLHARATGLKILVCSMHDENLFAQRALAAGACGYIGKEEATRHVALAIRQVLQGRPWLSAELTARMHEGGAPPAADAGADEVGRLTDRELAVFEMIGRGMGPTQIAEQIHLSVKTVETHREKIKRKLNLRSASELTRRAMLWNSGRG